MTASLQTKGNMYYVVLNWKDSINKRHQPWVSTGLSVSGNNKRKAEAKRAEILRAYQDRIMVNGNDMLFSSWLLQWLEESKGTIAESTYVSHKNTISNVICPWFEVRKIKLCDLKPYHIQEFYNERMKIVCANTIRHYHANIHKALAYAVKMERIRSNPADRVELPKVEPHIASCYTASQLKVLLDNAKGTNLDTVVRLAAWFGLRRGEIIGLRWSSIDFESNRLTVSGVIKDKGQSQKSRDLYHVPCPKTKSSFRSFPMTPVIVTYLKELRAAQVDRQKQSFYNHKWDDYVCVRDNGDLIPLEYVTRAFPTLCEKSGLPRLRLHELRHTNISLLLENGAGMKDLQEWAGHSSYSTTANIYSHVQSKSKERLAASMASILA